MCLVGIIHFNSFAGRSGEWQSMTKDYVLEQLRKGSTCLVCPNHKTTQQYGELGKHIPEGTKQAMMCYIGLLGKSSNLFLEPALPGTAKVSISNCLVKFAAKYFPEYNHMNVNLIRKCFTLGLNILLPMMHV